MPLPSSSRRLVLLIALGAVLAHVVVVYLATLVIWNDTPSVPRGLYLRHQMAPVEPGRTVILPVPVGVQGLVAERGYLPPTSTLMKVVAAMPGDRVCLDGRDYQVNGRIIARVRSQDTHGRPLPVYRFCDTVGPGQAFVATSAPLSFDSRYFGPVAISTLTVVTPLWMSSP